MSETLRKIKPLSFDTLPASYLDTDEKPKFEWVDPASLYVDSKYQRRVTASSLKLIKNIFENFSWLRFKPPVCTWIGDKLCVIDGQHTAIATASHPKIKKIPVMVVDANSLKEAANAFIGHNRDRIKVSVTQIYFSSLAAEDPIAEELKKALQATGCVMIHNQPPVWVEGQTLAAGTLLKLIKSKGGGAVERILTILMEAKRAPIISSEISAVADLIFGKTWAGKFEDASLSKLIASRTIEQWRGRAEATVRKGQSMASKRALAITWFKAVPKKRRNTGAKK